MVGALEPYIRSINVAICFSSEKSTAGLCSWRVSAIPLPRRAVFSIAGRQVLTHFVTTRRATKKPPEGGLFIEAENG
jgi:hypothetical protein